MRPLQLSIIIPTYNSAKTIKATLESVIRQDAQDFECIIIDGNSTDETQKILSFYALQYPCITVVSEPDEGIYDAMNKGIALSKGNYLYFMGSDDVFLDNKVLDTLFRLDCFGNTDLMYGDVVFKHSRIRMGEEKNYLKLIKNIENICHQSVFYSKQIFEKLGNYNLMYPIYSDFEMNIRCFRNEHITKKYINMVICVFNEKGTSYFHRNKDRYLIDVHELYVTNYHDPVAMFDTIQLMEAKVAELLNSKEYRLGKKIGDLMRKIKRFSR